MASNFIAIKRTDPAAINAALLLDYLQFVRRALEQGEHIKAQMEQMVDGADYTQVELYFGIPTGDGNTVYDAINGAVQAMLGTMQNDNNKTITELVG